MQLSVGIKKCKSTFLIAVGFIAKWVYRLQIYKFVKFGGFGQTRIFGPKKVSKQEYPNIFCFAIAV